MSNYLKWQKIFIYICLLAFASVLVYGFVSLFLQEKKGVWIIQSCIGIILLITPLFINRYTKITFSFYAYFAYAIIVILTILLGFILKFYETFTWYDIVTHSLSHLLLALFGIVVINLVFKQNGNANTFTIVLFAIAFALACGFIWELVEFSLDSLFGLNMQRFIPEDVTLYNGGDSFQNLNGTDSEIATYFKKPSGYRFALLDTMYDLFVDIAGAIVGAIIFASLNKDTKHSFYNLITVSQKDNLTLI